MQDRSPYARRRPIRLPHHDYGEPAGYYLTAWLPESLSFFEIPNLSGWILSSFNTAGQRAIQMGIALGIISMSLKLILGIERSYLGTED